MTLRKLFCAAACACACAWAGAQEANPFAGKVALIAGFDAGSEKAAQVRRFAATYKDSHPAQFTYATKTRPGEDRFRVLDPAGRILYEGGSERDAEEAVVNALTDMIPAVKIGKNGRVRGEKVRKERPPRPERPRKEKKRK